MTDETNPVTVTTTTTTFIERAEDAVEAGVEEVEAVFETGLTKAEALLKKFSAVELPIIENLLETLGSQIGKVALSTAMASVPLLESGGWVAAAASIGTAVVATATADAPADIQQALQASQLALQAVKVSTDTVVAGDAATVAAITAAVPVQ